MNEFQEKASRSLEYFFGGKKSTTVVQATIESQ